MILLIAFAGTWVVPGGGIESYRASSPDSPTSATSSKHLFLPCLTLTLGYLGEYAIIMRSSLLEVMGEDFIQTARAKGVRDEDVRRRHAVPNALLPTFTLVFYSVGLRARRLGDRGGRLLVARTRASGVRARSTRTTIPVIQGMFLLFSAAVIFFNLLADILYGYLDPRVKEG